MAIHKVQLGIINRGLVIADSSVKLVNRGLLGINLLLRHGAGALQQPLKTFIVQFGIAQ